MVRSGTRNDRTRQLTDQQIRSILSLRWHSTLDRHHASLHCCMTCSNVFRRKGLIFWNQRCCSRCSRRVKQRSPPYCTTTILDWPTRIGRRTRQRADRPARIGRRTRLRAARERMPRRARTWTPAPRVFPPKTSNHANHGHSGTGVS